MSIKMVFVALFFVVPIYTFPYSGRVINMRGSGIENAIINILNSSESCTTDADGYFGSSVLTTTKTNATHGFIEPCVTNNNLYFFAPANTPVSIRLFSMQGRMIEHRKIQVSSSGLQLLRITKLEQQANGIYLISLRIGENSYVLRFNSLDQNKRMKMITEDKGLIQTASAPFTRTGDSLVIIAHNYNDTTLFVPQSDFGTIVLKSETPVGMVRIHSKDSTFLMGSMNGEPNEMPDHKVTFTYDFYLDTVEVTQKQFVDLFSLTDTFYTSGTGLGIPPWKEGEKGPDYPAYLIDWDYAVLFCNALTKLSGSTDTVYSYTGIFQVLGFYAQLFDVEINYSSKGYRLPTEAEWEYACRAGTSGDYLGDSSTASEYGWFMPESDSLVFPVAQKKPNAFGLYDVIGNLYEWCQDFYDSSYYQTSNSVNPIGAQSGGYHVVRGGGTKSSISDARVAKRKYFLPYDAEGYSDKLFAFDPLGFRVCLPVKE